MNRNLSPDEFGPYRVDKSMRHTDSIEEQDRLLLGSRAARALRKENERVGLDHSPEHARKILQRREEAVVNRTSRRR